MHLVSRLFNLPNRPTCKKSQLLKLLNLCKQLKLQHIMKTLKLQLVVKAFIIGKLHIVLFCNKNLAIMILSLVYLKKLNLYLKEDSMILREIEAAAVREKESKMKIIHHHLHPINRFLIQQ